MFWKRKPTAASDAWLLAAISPLLDVMGMPSSVLLETKTRNQQVRFLSSVGLNSSEEVQTALVMGLYRGQRVLISRLQRAEPHRAQTDSLVYDLVLGILIARTATNAEFLKPDDGTALMLCFARRLQVLYANWSDFITALTEVYALQRELSGESAQVIERDTQKLKFSSAALLQPNALWQTTPWTLALPSNGEAELEMVRDAFLLNAIFYRDEAGFKASSNNWCLAVAAIYRAWWGVPIDSLEPAEITKHILERDWEVRNRKALLGTLESLILDGHCSDLQKLQRKDSSLPINNPLAWDLVRFMQIVTSGVCVGYVTLDEGRDLMLHAAKPLQAAYSSWAEMIAGFAVGRNLWQIHVGIQPDSVVKTNQDLTEILEILATDQRSPCLKVAWNQPLEVIPSSSAFASFPQVLPDHAFKHDSDRLKK